MGGMKIVVSAADGGLASKAQESGGPGGIRIRGAGKVADRKKVHLIIREVEVGKPRGAGAA
jgi:hypothetical protein